MQRRSPGSVAWLLLDVHRYSVLKTVALLLGATVLDLISLCSLYVLGLALAGSGRTVSWNIGLGWSVVCVIAAWGARAMGTAWVFGRATHTIFGLEAEWRRKILQHGLQQPLLSAQMDRGGESSNTLMVECRLAADGTLAAAEVLQAGVSIVLILTIVFCLAPWALIPAALAIIPGALVFRYARLRGRSLSNMQIAANRAFANVIGESFKSIKDIKIMGLEARALDEGGVQGQASSLSFGEVIALQYQVKAVLEFVTIAAVMLAVYILHDSMSSDPELLATLLFLVGAAVRSMPYATRVGMGLSRFSSRYNELQSVAAQLKRCEPNEVKTDKKFSSPPQWNHLEARDVSFSYDGSSFVVSHVGLTIHRGETVVLWGPSGQGKSTLLDLFAGLIRPSGGTVFVGGTPLCDVDPNWWTAQLGYVSQHPYVFYGTVMDNLQLAADLPRDEVIDVCKLTGFHRVVESLPRAYDTLIGEHGVGLSGGERQKLAITRLVLRRPGVMIFDEPTSGMDEVSELETVSLIQQIRNGAAVLVATHSRLTAALGDRVIEVNRGLVTARPSGDLSERVSRV